VSFNWIKHLHFKFGRQIDFRKY